MPGLILGLDRFGCLTFFQAWVSSRYERLPLRTEPGFKVLEGEGGEYKYKKVYENQN